MLWSYPQLAWKKALPDSIATHRSGSYAPQYLALHSKSLLISVVVWWSWMICFFWETWVSLTAFWSWQCSDVPSTLRWSQWVSPQEGWETLELWWSLYDTVPLYHFTCAKYQKVMVHNWTEFSLAIFLHSPRGYEMNSFREGMHFPLRYQIWLAGWCASKALIKMLWAFWMSWKLLDWSGRQVKLFQQLYHLWTPWGSWPWGFVPLNPERYWAPYCFHWPQIDWCCCSWRRRYRGFGWFWTAKNWCHKMGFILIWLGISQGFPINKGITIDPRYSNKGISISICLLVNWNDR